MCRVFSCLPGRALIQCRSVDSLWGVVDLVPDTDFPDFRAQSFIHSHDGTLFIIPRENDLIRLYIQQGPDRDVVDPATGRADKSRTSPEKLLEQGRKILQPYRMEMKDGKVNWWTVYVGACTQYQVRMRGC